MYQKQFENTNGAQSVVVNGRTDNTIAKRKMINNHVQKLHRKLNIKQHEHCSTRGTRRVTIVTNPVIGHEMNEERTVL